MIKKGSFTLPEGCIPVADGYQKQLAHYELLHLKPKGTIRFEKETKDITFQFFATEDLNEGIFARIDEPLTPSIRRIIDYIERYPRTESLASIVLLQFKMMFHSERINVVPGASQKTFHYPFPAKFYKTHRRRFIRIPFNESFPAELRFTTDEGVQVRKVRDLSREGLKIKIEDKDVKTMVSGARLKNAVLKLLTREIPVGIVVVSVYPGMTTGLRMVAMNEEDKAWLKEFIRTLMKQILNLPDPPFDDEIEKDSTPADDGSST